LQEAAYGATLLLLLMLDGARESGIKKQNMFKNIKKVTMLFFVAATMFTFASCNKDNEVTPNTNTTDDSTAVADTEWRWVAEDPNSVPGVISIRVEFNGPRLADLTYTDMSTGIMQSDVLMGTYKYSNGTGTLSLHDDDYNPVNISFTISGTTMTLKFKGITYSLTKQ
jgi:hypothetical protein